MCCIFITKMHLSKGALLEHVLPGFLWELLVNFPAHLSFQGLTQKGAETGPACYRHSAIVTVFWCYTNVIPTAPVLFRYIIPAKCSVQNRGITPCLASWHTAQPSCPLHNLAPEPLDSWLHKQLLVLSSRAEGQNPSCASPPAPKAALLVPSPALLLSRVL